VVDIGGRSLLDALERAGPDGDVVVIDDSVDRLEQLRQDCQAPNVAYLIGNEDVLPLPDGCADAVLGVERGEDVSRVLRSS
jgi:ubiquinone/menaquinone biosynthesis C-methylase UbiE